MSILREPGKHSQAAILKPLSRIARFKVEKVFLCLAIPFGLLFIFLSAPFQAPDEYLHFFHAYEVANGHAVILQARLPVSVMEFVSSVSHGINGNINQRQSERNLLFEFSRRFAPQPERVLKIPIIAVYSPLPYLPQAAGILLGRTLFLPPIMIFYLARLFNLITWIFLTSLAIRITPLHPRLFAALALMPMTMFLAASISPDAFTNGISFLWIAYALRLVMRPEGTLKPSAWGKLALLAIPLALCKSVYVIIAGLALLVPMRHARQWRFNLAGAFAVMFIAILVGGFWLQHSAQYVTAASARVYHMATVQEISYYFFEKPMVVMQIFSSSTQQYFWKLARMMIGVLGWVDTPLYDWVYPFYYLLLFFVVLFEPHPRGAFRLLERIWIAAMAVFSYFLVMATLFYPPVDVAQGRITLPQGRYYIPFAPLYFLPFSQSRWRLRDDSPAWAGWIAAHVLILGVAARILLWRYYGI